MTSRDADENWHYVASCPFDSSNRMAKYLIDCPFVDHNMEDLHDVQPLLAFCPVRLCRAIIDGDIVLPPPASSRGDISKE